jgi:hypothetical protein
MYNHGRRHISTELQSLTGFSGKRSNLIYQSLLYSLIRDIKKNIVYESDEQCTLKTQLISIHVKQSYTLNDVCLFGMRSTKAASRLMTFPVRTRIMAFQLSIRCHKVKIERSSSFTAVSSLYKRCH